MSVYKKNNKIALYVVSLAVLSVFIVGIADYLTNIDINLAIFYLFPISFVTWFAGRNEGVLISALAVSPSTTRP
jgi:hypothetical protein